MNAAQYAQRIKKTTEDFVVAKRESGEIIDRSTDSDKVKLQKAVMDTYTKIVQGVQNQKSEISDEDYLLIANAVIEAFEIECSGLGIQFINPEEPACPAYADGLYGADYFYVETKVIEILKDARNGDD